MQDKRNIKGEPIRKKEDIQNNPDEKIDEDFEGYPNGPARDDTIAPKTKQQKETADLNHNDGEKRNNKHTGKHKAVTDEQESDGSANAFDDK